jgi:hypothetical protein
MLERIASLIIQRISTGNYGVSPWLQIKSEEGKKKKISQF